MRVGFGRNASAASDRDQDDARRPCGHRVDSLSLPAHLRRPSRRAPSINEFNPNRRPRPGDCGKIRTPPASIPKAERPSLGLLRLEIEIDVRRRATSFIHGAATIPARRTLPMNFFDCVGRKGKKTKQHLNGACWSILTRLCISLHSFHHSYD